MDLFRTHFRHSQKTAQAVDKSARLIVIQSTAHFGASMIAMRRELRELNRPERVLVTPNFRPKATPIRFERTGRSPAVTIARPTPAWLHRHDVQFLTVPAEHL